MQAQAYIFILNAIVSIHPTRLCEPERSEWCGNPVFYFNILTPGLPRLRLAKTT